MKTIDHFVSGTSKKVLFALSLFLFVTVSSTTSANPQLRLRKSAIAAQAGTATVDKIQMRYHGGYVFGNSGALTIFWGPRWADPTFAGDKIQGLDQLIGGMNGSGYLAIANEYTGVTTSSTYWGHDVDLSPAPPDSQFANSGSAAVHEICKLTGKNPVPHGVYFVFTDQPADPNGNYCAYHDYGFCDNGKIVHYSYMPSLDGVAGCDPGDISGLHSQGLAALADSSAHEFMETLTDPNITAWYDATRFQDEVGDACSFTYTDTNPLGLISLPNGTEWRIQLIWSNDAFSGGYGQASETFGDPHDGRNGCIP